MRGVGVVVWVHSVSESALLAVLLVIQSAAEITLGRSAARFECAIPFPSHCSLIDYGTVFLQTSKSQAKNRRVQNSSAPFPHIRFKTPPSRTWMHLEPLNLPTHNQRTFPKNSIFPALYTGIRNFPTTIIIILARPN